MKILLIYFLTNILLYLIMFGTRDFIEMLTTVSENDEEEKNRIISDVQNYRSIYGNKLMNLFITIMTIIVSFNFVLAIIWGAVDYYIDKENN